MIRVRWSRLSKGVAHRRWRGRPIAVNSHGLLMKWKSIRNAKRIENYSWKSTVTENEKKTYTVQCRQKIYFWILYYNNARDDSFHDENIARNENEGILFYYWTHHWGKTLLKTHTFRNKYRWEREKQAQLFTRPPIHLPGRWDLLDRNKIWYVEIGFTTYAWDCIVAAVYLL